MPAVSDSPLVIAPRRRDRVCVLQLTDCHVFADAGAALYGVDPRARFEAVLNAAITSWPDADLIIATGDLAQDESADAYRYLAGRFAGSGMPTVWLPGNHDDASLMSQYLSAPNLHPHKRLLVGDWQILLLDSTLPGEVHGRVAEAEIAAAIAALREYGERPALVALHHQAVDSGSAWIDRKGLRDNTRLRQRLGEQPNLRAVIWGHVHQQTEFDAHGIRWLSTPSTCAQFAPASAEFALGDEAPGYRWLELHADGRVASGVERVEID